MTVDHFRVPAGHASAEIKVARSRFIAHVLPLSDEQSFSAELESLTRSHFDATHLCWAWRIFGQGEPRARSADAGEPSGTAGRPILQAIEAAGLFDLATVVARYYGGVKLGTGGLSRAYRSAAHEALAVTPVADRYLYESFEVEVPFPSLNLIYRMIAPPDIVLTGESFGERNVFAIDVRVSRAERFATELTAHRFAFVRTPWRFRVPRGG